MIGLSYILPCYNVGDFIKDCLDSIYSQRLSEEQFEVICINDCSTDNTREVLSNIQAMHSNLIILDQPRNMYSGAARNRGLDVAKGEYIWFVDSDDMIKPGVAKHLFDEAVRDDLDILYFNYDEISEDGSPIKSISGELFVPTTVSSGIDFVTTSFNSKLTKLSLLWCRLIKRTLIERYGIRFSDLYITQDAPFAWETLLRAEKVKAISDRSYIYRCNANSITAKKPNAKRSFTWSFQFPCEVIKLQERLYGIIPNNICSDISRSIVYELNQYSHRFKELPKDEKVYFYNMMREQLKEIHSISSYMNKRNRLLLHFVHYGYYIFNYLCSTVIA